MPIINAQGALGFARVSRASLPSGLTWITVGAGSVTSYPEYSYGITTDNAGNVIVVGIDQQFTTQAEDQAFLAKLDNSGIIQYGRYVAGVTQSGGFASSNFQAAAVDSSDNIYAIGESTRTTNNSMLLVKYNNAGTLLWQRQFQIGTTVNSGYDITVDSSGNSYSIGRYFSSPTSAVIVNKYDTSGTLQWSKFLQTPTTGNIKYPTGIVVDSSGNSYLLLTNATTNYLYLVKLDTSGTLVWQKRINPLGFTDGDANLSIYDTTLCIGYNGTGVRGYMLFDFNGNITQQRDISIGSTVAGTCIDESGNKYLLGQSISPNVCYITKINAAGQFVFARKISCATVGFNAGSIAYRNNQLYVALTATSNALDIWVLELPTTTIIPFSGIWPITSNGTTYTVLYENYGGTVATSTYGSITGDLTISNSGGSSYTSTLTNGARSLIWSNAQF